MNKAFHYFFGVLSVVTGIHFLYLLLTAQYGSLIVSSGFLCCISTVLFIMLEPRPRVTEYQRKEDDRIQGQGLGILTMIVIAAVIVIFASSCTTTGYGCHGRSHCITRVQ